MKSERFQYVLFFLLMGIFCWALYLRIVFDVWISVNIDEPRLFKRILYSLVERFGLGEGALKIGAILAPAAAAYFYRYYRDTVKSATAYMFTAIMSVLFMLWPAANFVHVPALAGLLLAFIAFCAYVHCLMVLSVVRYSKKMAQDQFNEKNQGFPQETKRKSGDYVFSLDYDFVFEGVRKKGT